MRSASHEFRFALVLGACVIFNMLVFIAWLSFRNYFATVFLGICQMNKKKSAMHLLDIRSTNRRAASTVNSNASHIVCVCVMCLFPDDDDNRSIFQFQSFGFSYAPFFGRMMFECAMAKDLRPPNCNRNSAFSNTAS